ncbi:hypothetical protein BV25DRAFT_1506428 [Artomyces pyxidatus]|uniref:Uncharacterized protein n=1 Tax=Artomyces pyxidatus TaxID=48021 RepID=A0ACB8TCX9_9AGAM|nr:hypothetical protein BV25DRAFT_1506428 [Artomyces pyxidatus]
MGVPLDADCKSVITRHRLLGLLVWPTSGGFTVSGALLSGSGVPNTVSPTGPKERDLSLLLFLLVAFSPLGFLLLCTVDIA